MARLFHSLVVCGAGLTLLQCGGRSVGSSEGEPGEGSESGASNAGSGGKGTAGSGVATGGISLGGSVQIPTLGGMSAGGSGPIIDPGMPVPDGPSPQWSCQSTGAYCSQGLVEITGLDCQRDASRPASPAECKGDAVFTCMKGYYGDAQVLFNCECHEPALDGSCVCPEFSSGCARAMPPAMCNPFGVECGCALTCILK